MSRVRFLIFPQKMVNICGRKYLDRTQIFWQVVSVQQPVQYGRDAAHMSWAAWVQTSLEDCMEERQYHLNESSLARLGRSQKLEILPSPNSMSLGAYYLMGAYILHRRRDFNVRLITVIYYGTHIFQICADILDMRRYFKMCTYILSMSRYFGYAQIF